VVDLLVAVPDTFGYVASAAGTVELLVRDPEPGVWRALAHDLNVGAALAAQLVPDLAVRESPRSGYRMGTLTVDYANEDVVGALFNAGWTSVDDISRRFVLTPPRPSPPRVVARDEFCDLIEGNESVATFVDPREVSLGDEGLFGVFAARQLGGSSALLALSGAKPDSSSVALLNPAALGLERVDHQPWSITASPVKCSVLALTSATREEPGAWESFADPEAVGQLWGTHSAGHADYWLTIELEALEVDPPVWLPAGQVFEQTRFTGRQTLAIRSDAGALVSPGRRATLLLPAYCLDRHLGSPMSDPMPATPFLAPLPSESMQQRVWQQRTAARGGVR
jgi:hypothetical protein